MRRMNIADETNGPEIPHVHANPHPPMKTHPTHVPSILSTGFVLGRRTLVALVLGLTVLAAAAGTEFSSVVVFGDSLSDTGRLYQLTDGAFPMHKAYWKGRQTNGPVWVEYLTGRLGLCHHVRNYAVVGAMTAPTPDLPTGNVWSDTFDGLEGTSLSGQLQKFLADSNDRADPDALYIIEGGANDLIHPLLAMLASPPAPAEFFAQVNALATRTVSNLVTIVITLRLHGARHIVVVNVPNFGKAPSITHAGDTASTTVTFVVDTINGALAGALNAYDASSGIPTARIDAAGVINDAAANPATYDFINVVDKFMTLDRTTGEVQFAAHGRHAEWSWFFWDDLHPTTHGHAVFAKKALDAIRDAFPSAHAHRCTR